MNRDMGPTRCPVVNLSRMRCEVEGKCGGSPGERGVAEAAMCAVVKSLCAHAPQVGPCSAEQYTKNATRCVPRNAQDTVQGVEESLQGGGEQLGSHFLKCAQGVSIAQGKRLPKRDIVDTTFHASCATRQISAKQSALPTS